MTLYGIGLLSGVYYVAHVLVIKYREKSGHYSSQKSAFYLQKRQARFAVDLITRSHPVSPFGFRRENVGLSVPIPGFANAAIRSLGP